jgi:hypothetical protein
MANQLNFPDELTSTVNQRPNRVANVDAALIRHTQKQILFGTSDRDNVELWVYEPTGTLVGHANFSPTDGALTLSTVVDQTGTYELLNIDMVEASKKLGLEPGRYVMSTNFFRDEVGSEEGYKLYISEISNDRTELRLEPVVVDDVSTHDIYEFVTPSVPREYAQGLMAEVLGQAIQAPPQDVVTEDKVSAVIGDETMARIEYSGTFDVYQKLLQTVLQRTYSRALDLMALDVFNYYVQSLEIETYVTRALDDTLISMINAGEIDPQFFLI